MNSTNTMKAFFETGWNLLVYYVNKESKTFSSIYIDDNKLNDFIQDCFELTEKIKINFMADKNNILDRHKLIAIFVVCATLKPYIETDNHHGIFIGKYIIALNAALSLLEDEVNRYLRKGHLIPKTSHVGIYPPNPTICDTKLVNSAARLLYWEEQYDTDDGIRVLELANTLFLIEQYTLLMNDIDIEDWTNYIRSL